MVHNFAITNKKIDEFRYVKFLFLLYFLFPLVLSAQFFNQKKDWFQEESFFNDSTIKENRIKKISISISNKKDGESIKKSTEKINYEFNRNGQILASKKIYISSYSIDTISTLFQYNHKNLLTSRINEFNKFQFKFKYFYNQSGTIIKELKLDAVDKRYDTLYARTFVKKEIGTGYEISTLNEAKVAFLKELYTAVGNTVTVRNSFYKNRNFTEYKYFFLNNRIETREKTVSMSKKRIIREDFKFIQNLLDEVSIFKDGILWLKRGIIYSDNGFPENIIERNNEEKLIRIYKLDIQFY